MEIEKYLNKKSRTFWKLSWNDSKIRIFTVLRIELYRWYKKNCYWNTEKKIDSVYKLLNKLFFTYPSILIKKTSSSMKRFLASLLFCLYSFTYYNQRKHAENLFNIYIFIIDCSSYTLHSYLLMLYTYVYQIIYLGA